MCEFGVKQSSKLVASHKFSDKKIAPTFLGWGDFHTKSVEIAKRANLA